MYVAFLALKDKTKIKNGFTDYEKVQRGLDFFESLLATFGF